MLPHNQYRPRVIARSHLSRLIYMLEQGDDPSPDDLRQFAYYNAVFNAIGSSPGPGPPPSSVRRKPLDMYAPAMCANLSP
jgi:hypothetical protein